MNRVNLNNGLFSYEAEPSEVDQMREMMQSLFKKAKESAPKHWSEEERLVCETRMADTINLLKSKETLDAFKATGVIEAADYKFDGKVTVELIGVMVWVLSKTTENNSTEGLYEALFFMKMALLDLLEEKYNNQTTAE